MRNHFSFFEKINCTTIPPIAATINRQPTKTLFIDNSKIPAINNITDDK